VDYTTFLNRRAIGVMTLTGLMLLVTGCVNEPAPKRPMLNPPPVKAAPTTPTNPTSAVGVGSTAGVASTARLASDRSAGALHDLAGEFLLYYTTRGELPPSLEALVSRQGLSTDRIINPATGEFFLYDPAGVMVKRVGARIHVIEASSRNGLRWGLGVVDATPGKPLVTKVVALTDADLGMRP